MAFSSFFFGSSALKATSAHWAVGGGREGEGGERVTEVSWWNPAPLKQLVRGAVWSGGPLWCGPV